MLPGIGPVLERVEQMNEAMLSRLDRIIALLEGLQALAPIYVKDEEGVYHEVAVIQPGRADR